MRSWDFCVRIGAILLLLAPGAHGQWNPSPDVNLAVCQAPNDQQFPRLVPDGQGGCFVIWQDARNGNRDIFAQHFNADGHPLWTPEGIGVCTEEGTQGWPEAITDGEGGLIILWGEGRHGNQDIYAQRIDADGRRLWAPEGIPVCVEPTLQEDITLISDGEGGAIAAWEDWRHGNQDIYAQRISPDGTMKWGANGIPLCRREGDQYDPVLASDGASGAIAAWWDISTPDWDIYAQRIASDGTLLWPKEGQPVCTAMGNQGGPRLVPDGTGGALAVWIDYRTDPLGDLYGQHLRMDGTLAWQAAGHPICALPNAQQQPTVISDGEGGMAITWWDERDVFSDIYAQRVDSDGKVLWTETGLPVCKADGVQREPQVVRTPGGVAIFWMDYRGDYGMTTVDHIYAQRIRWDGTILWEPDGLPVSTAEGEQSYPHGLWIPKGLVVVWMDHRNGDHSDIYLGWIPDETTPR